MDPVIGGMAVGGAMGALDWLFGNEKYAQNAKLARAQREWQEKMYRHRYQYTMEDLKQAGLNPILAGLGGAVGSAGGGAASSVPASSGSPVSSAMSTASAYMSLAKTAADTRLSASQKDLTDSRKVEQDINNSALPYVVRHKAEQAASAASVARSESVIKRAQEQFAGENAFLDTSIKRNRHSASFEDALSKSYRREILGSSPEYNLSANERKWLYRIEKGGGVLSKGIGSALGVGKLRYLHKLMR